MGSLVPWTLDAQVILDRPSPMLLIRYMDTKTHH